MIKSKKFFVLLLLNLYILSACTSLDTNQDNNNEVNIKRHIQYSQNYEDYPEDNVFAIGSESGSVEIPLEFISGSEEFEMGILIMLNGIAQSYTTENNNNEQYIHKFLIGENIELKDRLKFIPFADVDKEVYELNLISLILEKTADNDHEIQFLSMGRKAYVKSANSTILKSEFKDEIVTGTNIGKSAYSEEISNDINRDFYIISPNDNNRVEVISDKVYVELEVSNPIETDYRVILLIDENPVFLDGNIYYDFHMEEYSKAILAFEIDAQYIKDNSQMVFIISDMDLKAENERVNVFKSNVVYIDR